MNTTEQVVTRVRKETAVSIVTQMLPNYLEMLSDCKDEKTWQTLTARIAEARNRLKVDDYVLIYEDERRIGNALMAALMSPEDLQEFLRELSALSHEEQLNTLDEFGRPGGGADELANALVPDTPEEQQAQLDAFNALDEEGKQKAVRHSQYLMMFFLSWFHQTLAVMVHGEKMTSLVPKALAGDDEAALKAIHIDKSLLTLHPKFIEWHRNAACAGNSALLNKIAYRSASPATRGRVQLAGVFSAFALLESLGWLNDCRHREILSICDAAGLDRWQNRIEDENAVTKALLKYRRYQKTGGVSMH